MKKVIIASIISFIAGITLTVGASILYNAKDIEFTSSNIDFNASNVEDAIISLNEYNKQPIINKVSGDISNNYKKTPYRDNTGTTSLNLTKGDYYIFVSESGLTMSSPTRSVVENNLTNTMTNTSGTCEVLKGNRFIQDEQTRLHNEDIFFGLYIYTHVYKCSLTSNGTIKYLTMTGGDGKSDARVMDMYSIKID